MDPLTGVHVTACGLLALGGALKIARPLPASRALRSLHLPAPPVLVRLIGLGEVLIAMSTLALGGRAAFLAQASCFAAFAVVAIAFWRRGELPSCGCFGAVESPPSLVHVAVTGAAAGVCLRAGLVGADAPARHPGALIAGLVALAVVYLLLVDLPRLLAAVRLHREAAAA